MKNKKDAHVCIIALILTFVIDAAHAKASTKVKPPTDDQSQCIGFSQQANFLIFRI